MKLKKKKTFIKYNGASPEELLQAYCCACKEEHNIPRKDWIIVKTGKSKYELQCAGSLDKAIESKQK